MSRRLNLVQVLLHAEGAVLFAGATWAYFSLLEESWLWFAVLLLAPDISMLGYLRGPRLGAWLYDLAHTQVAAGLVLIAGLSLDSSVALAGGLILAAHIGMDRAAGYGLKFTSGFRDTHLQRVS